MREIECSEAVCENCPFIKCYFGTNKKEGYLQTCERVKIVRTNNKSDKFKYVTRVNKHKGR